MAEQYSVRTVQWASSNMRLASAKRDSNKTITVERRKILNKPLLMCHVLHRIMEPAVYVLDSSMHIHSFMR